MKYVKYLIILILTLCWTLLLLIHPQSIQNQSIYHAILTVIYVMLVYMVWPIGTDYSEKALNRFYIVIGLGMYLVALDVLMNNECPNFPFAPITNISHAQGIALVVLMTCTYLGKIPTVCLICLLGGRMMYLGYSKRAEDLLNWRKH